MANTGVCKGKKDIDGTFLLPNIADIYALIFKTTKYHDLMRTLKLYFYISSHLLINKHEYIFT